MKSLFSLLILSLSCQLSFAVTRVEDTSGLTILTPDLSDRTTRKIRLDNGLEAYLISDPKIHESGAAMAVGVGSWDDPQARPGMAHFVEHMLFLGTKKYPEEEGYQRYLDAHGGERNAFTMSDRTVYIFSCANTGFLEGLDRFAQFFVAPLFNPSGVDRESKAIDQEFCKDVPLDPWRVFYVRKELGCPTHPFHTFCIGNKETLTKISQDELKAWYESHYSATIMHLVVYSSLPLDTMEKEVIASFSDVPGRKASLGSFQSPLLDDKTAGKLVRVAPVQEIQELEMIWELPRSFGYDQDIQADELVSYVLGHEGEKSLLSILKKEKLAEALSSGASRAGRDQSLFTISIDLTSDGLANYKKVIGLTYEALATLKKQGIPKHIYDDYRQMKALRYVYQEREEPYKYVSKIASEMQDEPLSTFPLKTLMPTKYSKERCDELIAVLTPTSCHYTLVAPIEGSVDSLKKERWMGVVYKTEPLPKDLLTSWKNASPTTAFDVPTPNPFLPKELVLTGTTPSTLTSVPAAEILEETAGSKLYYAADDRFLLPEISWTLLIKTPKIRDDSARSHVLADLYCHAINEKLASLSYEAKLGGIAYALEPTHNALKLTLQGYQEKANVLLNDILTELKEIKITEKEFSQYKDLAEREYRNKLTKTPVSESLELLWSILYKDYPGPAEKSAEVTTVTYDELLLFKTQVFQETYLEGVLYGSQTKEQAQATVTQIKEKLDSKPYPKVLHPKVELAAFAESKDPAYLSKKSSLKGNVLLLTTDCGDFSFKRRGAQDILSKGLEEPFFTELRTKQQTGYVVSNWTKELERHLYSFFLVQSSTHDTRDLLSRFELFFENFVGELTTSTLPYERFESIKAALISNLEHPAEKLSKMGSLLYTLAIDYDGDFEWIEKRKTALQSLTYEEFQVYAREFLGKENRRRLALCINGSLEPSDRLHYRRLSTPQKIRKEISYKGREEALAERN